MANNALALVKKKSINWQKNHNILFCYCFALFQAKHAADFGMLGLILYSDPADYYIEGEEVYPYGIYLPGTGTQRGSTFTGTGDPVTPGYPATGNHRRA